MSVDRSAIIAAAAKRHLAPLGMTRKGRSRTWLDDHGWWVGIVEFQPSAWGPGSYLNVGLMFLWRPLDHLAFEIGRRVDDFSPADDEHDFGTAIDSKAQLAGQEITGLRSRFGSLRDVSDYFEARPVRTMYDCAHAATARALSGEVPAARELFDEALELREGASSAQWKAAEWMLQARAAANDESVFRAWAGAALTGTRQALRLPTNGALPST